MEFDQKTLDEPILPSQHNARSESVCKIDMLVQPDGPVYMSYNQVLDLARNLNRNNPPHVIGISIVCDTCHALFPHALAEKYSCRRKCLKCKAYYDICNECIANTETCPLCHEIDSKW
jgi:hypothetical protein